MHIKAGRLLGLLIAVVLVADVSVVARWNPTDGPSTLATTGLERSSIDDAESTWRPRKPSQVDDEPTPASSTTSRPGSPTTTVADTGPTTTAPGITGPAATTGATSTTSQPAAPASTTSTVPTGPSYPTYGPPPPGPTPPDSAAPTRTLACPRVERVRVEHIDRPGLYLIREDGTGLVRFTDRLVDATFSPDGAKVAFGGNPGICVADVNSGRATRIVDQNVSFWAAHRGPVNWAPDGSAFTSIVDVSSGERAYIFPIDGEPPIELENARSPVAWSPDGSELCSNTIFSLECYERSGRWSRRVELPADDDIIAGNDIQWLRTDLLALQHDGDVLLMKPDGSGQQRVHFPGTYVDTFDFRADGSAALALDNALWSRTSTGSTRDLHTYALAPTVAGNGRIVYMGRPAGHDWSMRSINADGSGDRLIAEAPSGSTNLHVAGGGVAPTGNLVWFSVNYSQNLPGSG